MATVGRHSHERLGHEAGEQVELPADLSAHLAVGGEPIGRLFRRVEGEVELELPGRILVVALDHLESHQSRVLDDPVDDRLQLGELVDVVAVGLRLPLDRRRSVGVRPEPHHLGLTAHHERQPGVGGELVMDPVEVAPAVRGQKGTRVVEFLPSPEQRAEDAGDLGVPGQHAEGVDVGQPHQLRRLRPVADVVAVPVGEEVGGGAVDELEALLRRRHPLGGRYPLSHHPAGDRDELVVDVRDALVVDPAPDLLDAFVAPVLGQESFEICRHAGHHHGPQRETGSPRSKP